MEEKILPDKKFKTKAFLIHLTIMIFAFILVSIIHFIIVMADGDPYAPPIIWLITVLLVVLMWLISFPITILWIKNLSYVIKEDRVTIQKGIITKTQQNIPYRAVTDFVLQRTMFDRMLGIGAVKVQTAGQTQTPSGYEGHLGGLKEYDKLHEQLRVRLQVLHPTAESLTVSEPRPEAGNDVLLQILSELKAIRKNLEK